MTAYYCCRALERLVEEAGIIRYIDEKVARHHELDLIEVGWQVIELDPAGERYYPIRFCPACGEMLDTSLSRPPHATNEHPRRM
jgi:hypothetical protein